MSKPKEYQIYAMPETPKVVQIIQHVLMAADIVDMLERRGGGKYEVLDPQMLEMAYRDLADPHPTHSQKIRRDDTRRAAFAVCRQLKILGYPLD